MLDICASMGWRSKVVAAEPGDRDHPPVRGMFFVPHKECEPVSFLFDDDGNLLHLSALADYDPGFKAQKQVSTKTQFAPVDIHIAIIKLLRYVKKKFFPNLNVVDEGEYWEREDRVLLEHLMRVTQENIDRLASALDAASESLQASESQEELLQKIESILKTLLHDDADVRRITQQPPDKDFKDWDISLN